MRALPSKRKTPTNLSVRADLVRRAKELDLNLSGLLETAIEQAIKAAERDAWLAANEDAIRAYNARVEKARCVRRRLAQVLMPQFDVFKNPGGGAYPLLLDVQADVLAGLATRVVVPLTTLKRYGSKPITRLNPTASIDGTMYVLVFQELAAIPAAALGEPITSLVSRRTDLVAAVDLIFTGI